MIRLERTTAAHLDFIALVKKLDAELAERDGEDHAFYDQFNKIEHIRYALVLYEHEEPIGCGAFKEIETNTVEVKRMYVAPGHRGKGLARKILAALESWAGELGYGRCILETGKRQPEAVSLYQKNGYSRIRNYGQYKGVENSLCFEKVLGP